jgi:glucose/mannose transport system substrate-binding protein
MVRRIFTRRRTRYIGAILIAISALALLGPLAFDSDEALLEPAAAQAAAHVEPAPAEVMHFWLAGSERAALDVFRDHYQAQHHIWIDSPMHGQSGLRRTLMDRFATGTPPTAVLWQSNNELRDLAELGLFAKLDMPANTQHWDAAIVPAVRELVQVDGHYYMAPTNIHGINWVFYSQPLLDRIGAEQPRTWPELIAVMRTLDAAGVRPVAIGPGDWETLTAFNGILSGSLGREDYRRLIHDQDASILDKPSALEAFRIYAELREIVHANRRYPGWSESAQAVARGEAGFQFMGDWAKGEMIRAGGQFGVDVGCMLAPGSENALMVTIDGFAFPADQAPERAAARNALAAAMLTPEVQLEFASAKGALGARMDAWPADPDVCEAIMIDRMSDDRAILFPPNAALPSALAGDYQIAMANYFNDPDMTPEQGLANLRAVFNR